MYIYQIMSNSFGYLDIILLAMIAGFIVLRLRNILGRKTGHQGKPFTSFSEKKFEEFKSKPDIKLKNQPTEFDSNQKKPLPLYPNKIGVISSGNGAVIKDIQNMVAELMPEQTVILEIQRKDKELKFVLVVTKRPIE